MRDGKLFFHKRSFRRGVVRIFEKKQWQKNRRGARKTVCDSLRMFHASYMLIQNSIISFIPRNELFLIIINSNCVNCPDIARFISAIPFM